ncbi:MAG: hypothetical protein U9R17_11155 [Thermodesulfobacteriota bacterium]|nr:hypothetical protein [Thermodesulfobacteriota bacterium]
MKPLALDIATSAQLLNMESKTLVEILQKREIEGIKIGNEWRLSVFVLSKILNTSPDEILEYLEDFYLAQRIEEVEDEPSYSPKEGKKEYEKLL